MKVMIRKIQMKMRQLRATYYLWEANRALKKMEKKLNLPKGWDQVSQKKNQKS